MAHSVPCLLAEPANKVDNLYPKLVWDEGTCVLGTAVNSLSSHHVVKTLGHYHLGPEPSWGPPGKRLSVPFPVQANQSPGASPASALFMAGQFPELGGGALPHWVTRSPQTLWCPGCLAWGFLVLC